MSFLKISGGCQLKGSVRVSGAKNSVTKLLIASLLSDKCCTIRNVPDIGDVRVTVDLCQEVGATVFWDKAKEIIEIQTPEIKETVIPRRFSNVNRIPVLLLGVLLARSQERIVIPALGGDAIGKRTLDFHIESLKTLGADIEYNEEENVYIGKRIRPLVGAFVTLPYPSVGATENVIFAAVRSKGTTVIRNAALEPEILDLVMFLQKAGVAITVHNDRTVELSGTETFEEVDHTVIPDRIEAASYGLAAVLTQGRVFVSGARHDHLIPLLYHLKKIGGSFTVFPDGMEFYYSKPLKGGAVLETDVYPSFSTDWQQPFAVLLTQAQGISVIHETVHENRLEYLEGLRKMGADCNLFHRCLSSVNCRYHTCDFAHSAVIRGKTPLKGMELQIPDLRAGFAYIMASLVADGESIIRGYDLLERGYRNPVEELNKLGAEVTVVTEDNKVVSLV